MTVHQILSDALRLGPRPVRFCPIPFVSGRLGQPAGAYQLKSGQEWPNDSMQGGLFNPLFGHRNSDIGSYI
jgi:hypothetical protein